MADAGINLQPRNPLSSRRRARRQLSSSEEDAEEEEEDAEDAEEEEPTTRDEEEQTPQPHKQKKVKSKTPKVCEMDKVDGGFIEIKLNRTEPHSSVLVCRN